MEKGMGFIDRWQPLPGGDHSALGDARATLAVLKRMAESASREVAPASDGWGHEYGPPA